MIEHVTYDTPGGELLCPRLVCDTCGEKLERAIDGYVFVLPPFEELAAVQGGRGDRG